MTAFGQDKLVLCALCGERVGVYEPVTCLDDGESSQTSLLRLREAGIELARVTITHAGCVAAG